MAGLRTLPPEARPRERLEIEGPEALSVRELLALVLRTGRPGTSALDLADQLLARFGGLEGLRRARIEELCGVPGMGPAKAAVLMAALELGQRASGLDPVRRPVVRTPADAVRVIRPRLEGREQEHFYVLLLNTRHEVMGIVEVARGGLNVASVCPREVFREAVRRGAHAVLLAHNHPSGNPEPSPEDVRLTERLQQVGRMLGILVLDHVVIGNGQFTSLRERGLGPSSGFPFP